MLENSTILHFESHQKILKFTISSNAFIGWQKIVLVLFGSNIKVPLNVDFKFIPDDDYDKYLFGQKQITSTGDIYLGLELKPEQKPGSYHVLVAPIGYDVDDDQESKVDHVLTGVIIAEGPRELPMREEFIDPNIEWGDLSLTTTKGWEKMKDSYNRSVNEGFMHENENEAEAEQEQDVIEQEDQEEE